MSALKNVIQKNKKTNPSVKPSKFYKPPEHQGTDDVALPDDVKIELSQDFDAHRSSGNAAERTRDFDRMHPVHGLNTSLKHLCTWCWVPLFGWAEAPVRIAWHLALFLVFTLLSLITACQVLAVRRMAWNHLRLVKWYLGVRSLSSCSFCYPLSNSQLFHQSLLIMALGVNTEPNDKLFPTLAKFRQLLGTLWAWVHRASSLSHCRRISKLLSNVIISSHRDYSAAICQSHAVKQRDGLGSTSSTTLPLVASPRAATRIP